MPLVKHESLGGGGGAGAGAGAGRWRRRRSLPPGRKVGLLFTGNNQVEGGGLGTRRI